MHLNALIQGSEVNIRLGSADDRHICSQAFTLHAAIKYRPTQDIAIGNQVFSERPNDYIMYHHVFLENLPAGI
jgi:hypothetical protein